jgi:hypothetical protein
MRSTTLIQAITRIDEASGNTVGRVRVSRDGYIVVQTPWMIGRWEDMAKAFHRFYLNGTNAVELLPTIEEATHDAI